MSAEGSAHAVTAAPFGSASILPITWMYIRMMGASGPEAGDRDGDPQRQLHRRAPRAPTIPCCSRAGNGRVAHECILDTRVLKDRAGVSVEDVAKRLIDYGFHAPTMSWPVAGTLMVEPTESEPKREIDRFCEAMIAIAAGGEKALPKASGRRTTIRSPTPRIRQRRRSPATGSIPIRGSRPPIRPATSTRRPNTGRRCRASTMSRATATWSAPARRSRRWRADGTPNCKRNRFGDGRRSGCDAGCDEWQAERIDVSGIPTIRPQATAPV